MVSFGGGVHGKIRETAVRGIPGWGFLPNNVRINVVITKIRTNSIKIVV